jgi:hypothetical protein
MHMCGSRLGMLVLFSTCTHKDDTTKCVPYATTFYSNLVWSLSRVWCQGQLCLLDDKGVQERLAHTFLTRCSCISNIVFVIAIVKVQNYHVCSCIRLQFNLYNTHTHTHTHTQHAKYNNTRTQCLRDHQTLINEFAIWIQQLYEFAPPKAYDYVTWYRCVVCLLLLQILCMWTIRFRSSCQCVLLCFLVVTNISSKRQHY